MIGNAHLKCFTAIVLLALPPVAVQAAVTIDVVPVGNTGNTADSTGYGAVDYGYNIGTYEVTAGQYAELLNAVGATDPHNLYHPGMWSHDYGCKIQQSGSPGSYTYSVASDWANRPVNCVSWLDALRFANWLTTGDTEDGVYKFSGGTLQSIMDHQAAGATYGTAFFLPTEDEWYKAAYHKNNGDTGDYFDYPTSSDTTPSNALVDPDPGNNATFDENGPWTPGGRTIGEPYYRTEVGAHENSQSPYGTFDQGGNVWEWNETYTGMRGGSCNYYDASSMLATNRIQYSDPWFEQVDVGFRVGSTPIVPEPGSFTIFGGLALIGLAWWRRRK